jgi:hypothetical protein
MCKLVGFTERVVETVRGLVSVGVVLKWEPLNKAQGGFDLGYPTPRPFSTLPLLALIYFALTQK